MTELQSLVFQNIFNAAREVGAKVCIAGGAVVDFDRASDVDVFVLEGKSFALSAALDPDYTVIADELYDDSDFQVVARCRPVWSPKAIQVTVRRDCDDVIALLNTFDLSVHQWAITPEAGEAWPHRVPTSSTTAEPIRVLRVDPTTPNRLVKLSQRYFQASA